MDENSSGAEVARPAMRGSEESGEADTVHEPLESLCCIFQAERHAEKLKESKRRDDGRLGNGLTSHRDLVVPSHQVNLREDPGPREVRIEVLNVRQWVSVIHCGFVQAAVVSARTPAS